MRADPICRCASAAIAFAFITLASACSRPVETTGGPSIYTPQDDGPPCWDWCGEQSPGPPGDGPGVTFAVRRLYFGDTDWTGTPASDAWKDFGYNIDGVKSTKSSTDHCKVNLGGRVSDVQFDGLGGIDNSFGHNLLPIFVGLASDWTARFNKRIATGEFTFLLRVDTLGGGRSYSDLPSWLLAGWALRDAAGSRIKPRWDDADMWPLHCELMTDCQPAGTRQLDNGNASLEPFPASYVTDGTWVSGERRDVRLFFRVDAQAFDVTLHRAVLSAELDSGDPPTSAARGILSGIVAPDDVMRLFLAAFAEQAPALCETDTLESIAQQVRAAADIMLDGTQDPGAFCNGISVGIGFDLESGRLGKVLDATTASPPPCPVP